MTTRKIPPIYNDDWRIYARSSSDDKSPIVAYTRSSRRHAR